MHRHRDPIDIRLWDLLQAGSLDRERKVSPNELLVLGAFVFGILLIGLVSTVLEFRKIDGETVRALLHDMAPSQWQGR